MWVSRDSLEHEESQHYEYKPQASTCDDPVFIHESNNTILMT